jgi:hypothetical protein
MVVAQMGGRRVRIHFPPTVSQANFQPGGGLTQFGVNLSDLGPDRHTRRRPDQCTQDLRDRHTRRPDQRMRDLRDRHTHRRPDQRNKGLRDRRSHSK